MVSVKSLIAEYEIAGETLDLYVINFDKEKMVLRVPLDKAKQIGMRKLANKEMMDGAMRTLRGRARVKRTMWSRRAQEYEAKINSGDIIAISEVVETFSAMKTSLNNPIQSASFMRPPLTALGPRGRSRREIH